MFKTEDSKVSSLIVTRRTKFSLTHLPHLSVIDFLLSRTHTHTHLQLVRKGKSIVNGPKLMNFFKDFGV